MSTNSTASHLLIIFSEFQSVADSSVCWWCNWQCIIVEIKAIWCRIHLLLLVYCIFHFYPSIYADRLYICTVRWCVYNIAVDLQVIGCIYKRKRNKKTLVSCLSNLPLLNVSAFFCLSFARNSFKHYHKHFQVPAFKKVSHLFSEIRGDIFLFVITTSW